MIVKVTEGQQEWHDDVCHLSLPTSRLQILSLLESRPITWVLVTSISPSASAQQLKLQATYTFQFICTHIIDDTCPKVWKLERLQSTKVTFKVFQRHWCWWQSIGYTLFPSSLLRKSTASCTIFKVSTLTGIYQNLQRSHDPKHTTSGGRPSCIR